MKKKSIKLVETVEEYQKARQVIRMLVRAREDFQAMRKRMDNRMGRKADGTDQDIDDGRAFDADDASMFIEVAGEARSQESAVEKKLLSVLRRMPIYTEWLDHVKGVGTIAAGWICGEFDIYKANTVSKLWQYSGLNPGMVRGKKRVDHADGEGFDIVVTDTMIRGDRLTEGFVAPFNKRLRTALVGVMADGFIKCQNEYALTYYYPYKARLEKEAGLVTHMKKEVAWSDVSKGHRDRAAKRYMVKMFERDLYNQWRPLHGLEVRAPYQEAYLGQKHAG